MSHINKSFSHHPHFVTSRQGSPKRVRGHHTHVSCLVASVHLLAVVGVYTRQALHARVTLRGTSNGMHITVSVAEGCRTIGPDVTWGDVIIASGGHGPQWRVASGRTTVIRPSVRRCSRWCCTPSGLWRPIRRRLPRTHTRCRNTATYLQKRRNIRIVSCTTTTCCSSDM